MNTYIDTNTIEIDFMQPPVNLVKEFKQFLKTDYKQPIVSVQQQEKIITKKPKSRNMLKKPFFGKPAILQINIQDIIAFFNFTNEIDFTKAIARLELNTNSFQDFLLNLFLVNFIMKGFKQEHINFIAKKADLKNDVVDRFDYLLEYVLQDNYNNFKKLKS